MKNDLLSTTERWNEAAEIESNAVVPDVSSPNYDFD